MVAAAPGIAAARQWSDREHRSLTIVHEKYRRTLGVNEIPACLQLHISPNPTRLIGQLLSDRRRAAYPPCRDSLSLEYWCADLSTDGVFSDAADKMLRLILEHERNRFAQVTERNRNIEDLKSLLLFELKGWLTNHLSKYSAATIDSSKDIVNKRIKYLVALDDTELFPYGIFRNVSFQVLLIDLKITLSDLLPFIENYPQILSERRCLSHLLLANQFDEAYVLVAPVITEMEAKVAAAEANAAALRAEMAELRALMMRRQDDGASARVSESGTNPGANARAGAAPGMFQPAPVPNASLSNAASSGPAAKPPPARAGH